MNIRSFLFLLLFNTCYGEFNAQTITCQELVKFITEHYEYKDKVNPVVSSLVVKATWYEYEGEGFVIAYLKRDEYDLYGSPYIFCGVSRQRWNWFKGEGLYGGSYGSAFHKYIMDYTCNCK